MFFYLHIITLLNNSTWILNCWVPRKYFFPKKILKQTNDPLQVAMNVEGIIDRIENNGGRIHVHMPWNHIFLKTSFFFNLYFLLELLGIRQYPAAVSSCRRRLACVGPRSSNRTWKALAVARRLRGTPDERGAHALMARDEGALRERRRDLARRRRAAHRAARRPPRAPARQRRGLHHQLQVPSLTVLFPIHC